MDNRCEPKLSLVRRAVHKAQGKLGRWALLLAFGLVACDLTLSPDDIPDGIDDIDIHADEGTVRSVLAALFPDLSTDELTELQSKLSLSAVLELKVEIEALRTLAARLSKELSDLSTTSVKDRNEKLASRDGGFPEQLTPVGLAAFYDGEKQEGRVDLSAVFQGREAMLLATGEVSVAIDGALQTGTLTCTHQGEPVDIVLLVDVTGSMSSVIHGVRDSLVRFVNEIVAAGVNGTLSVVTFQDSVGVNLSFQEPRSKNGFERSPFMAKVAIDDPAGIEQLRRFLARLEADSGKDRAENLAAALDFANNNTLGIDHRKQPNLLGDGIDDPSGVSPFPMLANPRRIFAAFTDAPFHADSRTASNSSLVATFDPRPIATILQTLQERGTTVHVCDPSWVDLTVAPSGGASESEVDSDYWAIYTGGVGEDRSDGYALNDLELLASARETGLLDVILDGSVKSSCSFRFARALLSADARFELNVQHGTSQFTASLLPTRL